MFIYLCSAQWQSQPDIWSYKCKFFSVFRPYKESISKEIDTGSACVISFKVRLIYNVLILTPPHRVIVYLNEIDHKEKIAACIFYKNALQASIKND